jgi:hypothetical protein
MAAEFLYENTKTIDHKDRDAGGRREEIQEIRLQIRT